MIFFKPVYDAIITTLIQHTALSIQDLYWHIKHSQKISLANFYKVIQKLVEQQVLYKEQWLLYIHSKRIVALQRIVNELQSTYQQHRTILPKPWETLRYNANSLKELDGIRDEVLLTMARKYWKSQPFYNYNAHAYNFYGMWNLDKGLFEQLSTLSNQCYMVLWNDTPLDTYAASIYSKTWVRTTCTTTHTRPQKWYYLNLMWSYSVECVFPTIVSEYFETIFSTTDISTINQPSIQLMFATKVPCKITVKNNEKHAERLAGLFKKIFYED